MSMPQQLQRISETVWELPVSYKPGMRVPARIYGTEKLIKEMDDAVYDQVTNVAMLPGVTDYALCMPDGHFGYGFPIGGVAAMDIEKGGVISPGGIGFDINCGMRLIKTDLDYEEVKPRLKELVDALFAAVPAGVGSTGFLKLTRQEFRDVVEQGAGWCVRNGYGWNEDLELTEDSGCTPGADASTVSEKAIDRGFNQIGTLGSGNHYLEVQVVHEQHIFDADLAAAFGLAPGRVVVMFHCGSRGFGHQVATDYLRALPERHGEQVRHPRPRPRACLRPLRFAGGAQLFLGHEVRPQHVLREPPDDPPSREGGLLPRLRQAGGKARRPDDLRRGAQYGQAGAPHW